MVMLDINKRSYDKMEENYSFVNQYTGFNKEDTYLYYGAFY